MSDLTYIGLDFETTGIDFTLSAPIQLGIALEAGTLTSMIGGWNWSNGQWTDDDTESPYYGRLYDWSIRAEEIHGIDRETLKGQPYAPAVDAMMAQWIAGATNGEQAKNIIAVGWNIASFDVPFLREYFPQVTKSIAYRTVDLNAVIFAMTESGLFDKRLNDPWTYYSLKGYVKDQAAMRVPGQERWHDAGYDAATSLAAFRVLTEILGGRYA